MENHIAEMRKKAGMTQERLARALGVSQQQLSEWERGIRVPAVTTAIEIARLLDCRVEDLYMP